MASFRVFCTPTEFGHWLQLLREAQGLTCLWSPYSARVLQLLKDSEPLADTSDAYGFFLFPGPPPDVALTWNEVKVRPWGWIYVLPGRLTKGGAHSTLFLSTIHGEDFSNETVHPARYVRWLKRK